MIKTEIISNVCLICINVTHEITKAVSHIETSMNDSDIDLLFVSAANIFGHTDKIYIAVYEKNIFDFISVLGKIRSLISMKNYCINCSNSMIRWHGKVSYTTLQKAGCDIKLALLLSNEGVCFCDNAYRKRVNAILNSHTHS